jgi:hypothetical protein
MPEPEKRIRNGKVPWYARIATQARLTGS